MKTCPLLCAVLAALILSARPAARADVIYSTFGPGDSYNADMGQIFAGPDFSAGRLSIAVLFGSPADYTLDSVDAAMVYSAGADTVRFSIISDNNDQPTGTILVMDTLYGVLQDSPALVHWIPSTSVSLRRDTAYWFVVEGIQDFFGAWQQNDQRLTGIGSVDRGSGWTRFHDLVPAYRLSGTPIPGAFPVPEPGALAFLLIAVGMISRTVRKKYLRARSGPRPRRLPPVSPGDHRNRSGKE
jgi:hypothetical protein